MKKTGEKVLGAIGNAALGGLTGGIGSAVTGLVGSLFGNKEDVQKKQMEQNKELMQYQASLNEKAAEANQQRAKDMWWYTATNERAALEAMGLNPALMYGGSSGGSASGSGTNAGTGIMSDTGVAMALQAKLQKAQIDSINAQTAKTNAETKKISGVDTDKTKTEIDQMNQSIKESLEKTRELFLGNNFSEETFDMRVNEVSENYRKLTAETNKLFVEASLTEQQKKLCEKEVKAFDEKLQAYLDQVESGKITARAAMYNAETMRDKAIAEITKIAAEIGKTDSDKIKNYFDMALDIMDVFLGGRTRAGKNAIMKAKKIFSKVKK